MGLIISAIKIIFLLGFLVLIHESGHFFVAKLCKIKVNEFAIGFGPAIWSKQGKITKYALRLVPFGGFVNMEGEEYRSKKEGSFSEASVIKRIAIVAAGGLVNIVFAILVFWGIAVYYQGIQGSFNSVIYFIQTMFEGIIRIFTGNVTVDEMVGPVGISNIVSQTNGIIDYLYILAVVSLSLGVTNLLPFPPLDGGKVCLLILEGIRKKPFSEKVEVGLQSVGFIILMTISIYVTYNDIIKL